MGKRIGLNAKDGKLFLEDVELGVGSANNKFNKICVYGTSIETTPGSQGKCWPKYMAQALGLTYGAHDASKQVVNHAKGGAGVTWWGNDVRITSEITAYKGHLFGAIACTPQEKQAAADYFKGNGLITDEEINSAKNGVEWDMCYTDSLLNQNADLYIFGTYGINDRHVWMKWVEDETEFLSVNTLDDLAFDRRTIYGAYNYLLRALYNENPNAKVVILGQHMYGWGQQVVNGIQRAVAEKWNIPFADWSQHLSLNQVNLGASNVTKKPSIYQEDSVHLREDGAQLLGTWVADWITRTELTPLNPRWDLGL